METNRSSPRDLPQDILVKDAANVEIEGLIVDTANNGITQCAPDLMGILYQNSSGSIEHNAVRNTKLSVSLNGCQSGDAIVVQSLGGETSKVSIDDNSIQTIRRTESLAMNRAPKSQSPTTLLLVLVPQLVPHKMAFKSASARRAASCGIP